LTKLNYFIAELNQLITEWGDEEASNNEDCGPFLKIESVVSLNPEAMGAEDVSFCLILFAFYCVLTSSVDQRPS
jgi:hypothetical protein